MPLLTFEKLHGVVAGNAVAMRSRSTLQPAGGEGDKIFPPSSSVDGRAEHKYQKPIDSLDGIVSESRLGDPETPTTYGRYVGGAA